MFQLIGSQILRIGRHLKFQSTGLTPLARTNHAIDLLIGLEGKIHPRFHFPAMNNIVLCARATIAPEGPGEGFQEGGFSGTIGSTNTGGMQPMKVEGSFAIAQKVF